MLSCARQELAGLRRSQKEARKLQNLEYSADLELAAATKEQGKRVSGQVFWLSAVDQIQRFNVSDAA